MLNDRNWTIREFVVETDHWHSGKEILISRAPDVDPKTRVLGVREAGKSLVRVCQKPGVGPLPHHDLRDVFATSAIRKCADDEPAVNRRLAQVHQF